MEINRFGYYWLDTWVLANIIQLATQDFCTRFLNKPMIKRVAKKGINSGKEFWSCSDYPKCNGTKPI